MAKVPIHEKYTMYAISVVTNACVMMMAKQKKEWMKWKTLKAAVLESN